LAFRAPVIGHWAAAYAVLICFAAEWAKAGEMYETARARINDLRLSTYVVASTAEELAEDEALRSKAVGVLRELGISKVYLEIYRGGLAVDTASLACLRDFFEEQGLTVAGGIATVPGDDFGVPADCGLEWFNFQNEKTQRDLERVVRAAATVFDEFIVDDFLCTTDVSAESDAARRGRSWTEYRRDLLTALSWKTFIAPAKEVRPGIRMIIKYPQWYDRFHLFGYDVEREPQLFDAVWVGTETRGANTPRFGYVQPYEGFVNYRWLAAIAGKKIGGAWFDHYDCDAQDFIDQAWQTVLAGAPEIILFNYADLAAGHPGHELLRRDFMLLADLAHEVRRHPVCGLAAYKPPHSDAGGDMYLMDYVGMLGIPLAPYAVFPEDARAVFLPAQAAAGTRLEAALAEARNMRKTLIMTAGFLAAAPEAAPWCSWAGLAGPVTSAPRRAPEIAVDGHPQPLPHGLDLEADLHLSGAKVLLEAVLEGHRVPFLTECTQDGHTVVVLNVHTFSEADFDAAHEMLLSPRPL